MKIPASRMDQLLESSASARLATINPDGTPHQVPIVFTRVEGNFWSPIDGKPKQTRQLARIRNVSANRHGSLLIDHYDDDWSALWWIRIDVRIDVVQWQGRPADHLLPVLASFKKKYLQYATTPVVGEPPTLLCMTQVGLNCWCAANIWS